MQFKNQTETYMFQMKLQPDRHKCMHAFKHTCICTHAYVFYMWPNTTLTYIRQTTQKNNVMCQTPLTICAGNAQIKQKTKKKNQTLVYLINCKMITQHVTHNRLNY